MSLLSSLGQYLGSGDPIVKTWFLVQQSWIPFVFSAFYVFFVRRLGPYLMQQRQPMDLRKLVVVYNISIVAVYIYAVYTVLYNGFRTDCFTLLCIPVSVSDRKEYYKVISALWIIYALKYVEYADTVFYVLRKKFHLISHLHVIHHAVLPIIFWFMFRTERTGFQIVPTMINSCIHIIMYTYYALSAMGPKFQKILWWKRYLTLLQMAQFVVILFLMSVVAPAVGCKSSQEGTRLTMFFAALFLLLFYNFYAKTYRTPLLGGQHGKSNDVDTKVVDNGPKQGVVCSTSRKDSWPRHRF